MHAWLPAILTSGSKHNVSETALLKCHDTVSYNPQPRYIANVHVGYIKHAEESLASLCYTH